jgi:predicted AAA+ superfamily ATPase
MQFVTIKNGTYRNAPVVNTVFPLVKDYQEGAKGGFLTVDARNVIGFEGSPGIVRIKVEANEYEIVGTGTTLEPIQASGPKVELEPEEKVIERIAERFAILDEMTRATINGDVRAMIVVGPPGVGKSYGVEYELQKNGLIDDLAGNRRKYEVVKGAMTPIGLYAKLYEFAEEGNVLVFDDCDSILLDDISLNVLKAALDSSKKRTIHWNADSRLLRSEGIPNKFDFKGAVIFITNLKFDNVRSAKLKDHLEALMSRCHYLDLTIDTARDKLLRIKQIAQTGTLFPAYGMTHDQEQEIIDFMIEHQTKLRELSLRMAIKLADLRRMSEERWKAIAMNTCMKMG